MDELKALGKPFDIWKRAFWEAWEKVKTNKGAPGVGGVTVAEFECATTAGILAGQLAMPSFGTPQATEEFPCPRSASCATIPLPPRRSGVP